MVIVYHPYLTTLSNVGIINNQLILCFYIFGQLYFQKIANSSNEAFEKYFSSQSSAALSYVRLLQRYAFISKQDIKYRRSKTILNCSYSQSHIKISRTIEPKTLEDYV